MNVHSDTSRRARPRLWGCLLVLGLALSSAACFGQAAPLPPIDGKGGPTAGEADASTSGDGGASTSNDADASIANDADGSTSNDADGSTPGQHEPGSDASGNAADDAAVTTPPGAGLCCADGHCYCRGDAPTKSSSAAGPYQVASYTLPRSTEHGGGTIYYPSDAEPPFAGAVFCPGLGSVQALHKDWGTFLASWGIVLVTMDVLNTQDSVAARGKQLLAMATQLRGERDRDGSPLRGKLGDRIGTMGWSMGGGASWIAAAQDPTLKSSISLAGHNATGGGAENSKGTTVPSLLLNGGLDRTILGGQGQSQGVYRIMPDMTPKLMYVVGDQGHFNWSGPTSAGPVAGEFVLSFQKTFLEGDTRWRQFLYPKPANASEFQTNLK